LASVTYSGAISLAALVKVNASTPEEFKARKEEVYTRISQYIKIDASCGNPSRWTRCPQGLRHVSSKDETYLKNEQRLIALNLGPASWQEYQKNRQIETKKVAEQALGMLEEVDSGDGNRTPVFESISFTNLHAQYGISYNGNKPVVNLAAVTTVLTNHPEWRGKIFYDTFLNRTVSTRGTDAPAEWTDFMDSQALVWLQRDFGLQTASIEDVRRAIPIIAHGNQTNCLQAWLSSIEWDNQPRLSSLLPTGFGAVPSEYHSRVGECWLISMVARAMHPGCKVDTLPVFEGDQGAGKSSGLRILGGKLFTECHEQITSKDFYSVLSGRWLVEISEMHSFNKAEVERIKGIISNQTDRYRLPYDRHASDHPRQCVFAGTTNRDDWHSDETGGRRFWPVACGTVNQVWLRENREQLFAEAFVRYQRGESWWDVPSDQQREKIEDRRQEDAWTAPIARFLENRSTVSLSDVLRDGIQKPIEHHTPNDTRRVAKILRDLNFENYSERVAGVKKRMWRKKSNPPLHE
jgi:predicted P-loop ATPase